MMLQRLLLANQIIASLACRALAARIKWSTADV